MNDTQIARALQSVLRISVVALAVLCQSETVFAQWTNGTNINNTNSGNVGIGTTAPNAKLEVHHASAANTPAGVTYADIPLAVRNTNNTNGNFNIISFLDANGWGNVHIGAVQVDHSAHTADFFLSTRNANNFSEKMRIKADGSVGIGTNNPGHKLDVQGGQINSSVGLCIAGDCKTAWSQVGGGSSQWTTAGSAIHYSTGNVGIGNASPGSKLFVGSGTPAVSTLPGLNVALGGASYISVSNGTENIFMGADASGYGILGTLSNHSLGFRTNNMDRIRIDASGNVGIGLTAPNAKLHVAGGLFVGTGTPAAGTLPGLNVALGGASYISASNGTENIFMGADASGHGILGTLSNHSLAFRTNNAERLRIDTSGNVGIGIAAPTAKLHVAGDGKVTGNLTVDGNVTAKYQDVAEWVPAARELPPGTVVTLNRSQSNFVEPSSKAYDTRVAGVISEKPGIVLGEHGENKVLVATTGRVRIKVDATNAPIEIGDLLVTSDKEGVAMKSMPINLGGVEIHRPGTLIGKALEPLAKGKGEILVLLSLQ